MVMNATSTTVGTKYPATTSASFWIGARERCASLTMLTICASSVSAPTFSARINRLPVPLTVAPIRVSPSFFSIGIDSPVTIDSFTALLPLVTMPSTGIFSPGLTRKISPGLTSSRAISSSCPSSRTILAVFGASPSNSLIAALVWLRARNSSTWPSRTRVVITAAASKYTATVPPGCNISSGNMPGSNRAITL